MAEQRLIDAEALLKKLSKMIDYCEKNQKVNGLTALFQVGDAIMDCPTIEAKPVVHGRWLGAPLCGNDNCKCSECGSWHNIHVNLRGEITQKYCPSCGAKMDGEEE